jgi:hypothetical protein
MSFSENLIKLLQEKGLGDSSIKLYLRNLKKLNGGEEPKKINFLEKVDIILDKLKDYEPNTVRNYLISIVSVLGVFKTPKLIKLRNKYYNLMNDKSKEIKQNNPQGKMSEKQIKNWITAEEVKEKYDNLEAEVKKIIKNKEINENQYNILLSYVVLSLYTLMKPRRNDYQICNIVKLYNNSLPNDKNYLSYDSNDFIFNVFKTSKIKGQQIIKFDDSLKAVFDIYFKYHPLIKGKRNINKKLNVPFLVHYDGSEFGINTITKILNKIFKKHVGSSMLRHLYHSDKYSGMIEEMKQDADEMGHTVETVIKDYIKNPIVTFN